MSWFPIWFGMKRSASPRRTMRLQIEELEQREVPTVNYYGGALLTSVEAQAIFYGNEWSSGIPATQTSTINSFLTDITGGAYMTALQNAGYGVGPGTASAGYVDNTALTPGSTITDASIQNAIKADLGQLQSPDANRLYVVYVEPNVAVNLGGGQGTTTHGVLGYHGAFAGPGGVTIHYAVIAYPGGSVGNSSLGTATIDQLTAVTSHELAEAVTDPNVNFGTLGWYDPRRGEIGDITENNPAALVRLNGYLVQEVSDKNDQLLAIQTTATPIPPTPTPAPSPVSKTSTTTTLTAGPVQHHRWGPPTVTLTVTITPGSGSVQPNGLVELFYNGQVLGVARVRMVNGVATATFTVEFFGSGTFGFSAQYVGNSRFEGSSSNTVNVTI